MTLTGTLRSLRATGGGGLFEGDLVCWALSSFLDSYTFILFYVSRFQVILFQTRVHGLNFFSKFLFVIMLKKLRNLGCQSQNHKVDWTS